MNDNEDPQPPASAETSNEAPPGKSEDYLIHELQSRIEYDAKLVRDDIDKSGVGWGQAHSTKSLLGDIVLASWKLGQIASQARANMRTLSQKLIDEHGQVQALIVERNCLKLANEELREGSDVVEAKCIRLFNELNDRRVYPLKYAREEHEAEIEKLRKGFKDELNALAEENERLKREFKLIEGKYCDLKSTVDAASRDGDARPFRTAAIMAECDRLKAANEELKAANDGLKTANAEWRERAEKLEGMFHRASKEANDRRMYPMKYAREQHEAAVEEFRKAFEAERDSLAESLAAERRACAEMKEKLDSAERKVLGLTVSLGEANRTCADMRRGLDLRKERIIALNEELRLERSRVMSFRKEHDILIEERVKLIDERESLQSKLEKQLSDVQKHLAQTSKEYDRVSASLRQAELNLGAYRSRCESMNGLQAKVEELQSALDEAKAESRSRYESKMDAVFAATKLQSKLHEANLREGLTSDELAKKIEENKKLTAEVKELKSAIACMDFDLVNLKKKREIVVSAFEAKTEETRKLYIEVKNLKSALDAAQLSLKYARADLAVALGGASSFSALHEKHTAELKKLKDALEHEQWRVSRLEGQVEDRDTTIASLREDIERSSKSARKASEKLKENAQYWRDIYSQCDSEREKLKRELAECQALAEKLAAEVESLTTLIEQHAKEHEEGDA